MNALMHATCVDVVLCRAHERQAILSNASSSPQRIEVARLQAEVEAKNQVIQGLEADLAAQSAAASSRLSELQASFQAKIADMRRVHQEQLTAAEKSGSLSSGPAQVWFGPVGMGVLGA